MVVTALRDTTAKLNAARPQLQFALNLAQAMRRAAARDRLTFAYDAASRAVRVELAPPPSADSLPVALPAQTGTSAAP